LLFAFDVSERVYTIEACAVPGGVYTTEPELHPEERVCSLGACTDLWGEEA